MARFLHGGASQTFSVALQPEWDIDFWWRSQDVHLAPPGELRRFQLLLGLEWCHGEMKETARFSCVRPSVHFDAFKLLSGTSAVFSSIPDGIPFGIQGSRGPRPGSSSRLSSSSRLWGWAQLLSWGNSFLLSSQNNPLHSPRVPFPHNMDASTSLLTQTLLWKCETPTLSAEASLFLEQFPFCFHGYSFAL